MLTPHFYSALRAVHLFITAAVMPLGVWGYLQFDVAGGGARLALFLVGSVLALFVLALDQADYPVTSLGAVRRTAPLVVNLALGFWHGGGEVFAAAHWTLTSLLASLAAANALLTVLTLRHAPEERRLALQLLLPLSLAAVGVALVVAWPLLSRLTASASLLGASIAWLVQTASTTRAWLRQSVFSRTIDTPEARARVAAMTPWNGAVALAFACVMAALAFVLLFTVH